ncbi:MAG: PfkB family carbohydrate kinase [Gemmatimonadaceae bacterium]|nr:PfkB family carbohydrate kinase [Gemmatimonadaceae bacterium]
MASPADVAGLGMVTVDHLFLVPGLPAVGAPRRASGHARACGGPVPNALACLSRLGISTRFVGKVGDDEEGGFARSELLRQGVDVSRVRVARGRSRLVLVIVEEDGGERAFVSLPESFPPLTGADLEAEDVAGARVLHLDDADDAAVQAARRASASGAAVVFDGTWQSDRLEELLPLVDYAVVSEFFARRWLPGAGPWQVLRRLRALGAGTAVLTRGEHGAAAEDGRGPVECPAPAVEVVDTTGAGDAFHGGFIFGVLQGWPLDRSLRYACAAGALNCRALGGQAGLPSREEVEELLAASP